MKKKNAIFCAILLASAVLLAGCKPIMNLTPKGNTAELEDATEDNSASTAFFTYVVHDAYTCKTAGDYTAPDGETLLVVSISVQNTFDQEIPMSDVDFQAQWGDDADDAYAFAVTTDEPVNEQQVQVDSQLLKDQLPTTYDMAKNEVRSGLLIFQVPEGYTDFSLSYEELYEDNSTGDTFFVYFTAQPQEAASQNTAAV